MLVTDRYGTQWSIHVWHSPRDREFEAMPIKEQRLHPERRPLTRATLHLGDCGAKRGVPCTAKDIYVAEARRGERDFYKPETGAKVALARAMKLAGLGPFPADHHETTNNVIKAEEIRKDLWQGYVKAARLVHEVPQYQHTLNEGDDKYYVGPFETPELADVAIRKLQKLARRRQRGQLIVPLSYVMHTDVR